jgi:hypothetical protein
MAVRQVGLLGRYDPLDVKTSNYPQIGFVDIESSSFIGNSTRNEIGDQTVEVLRQAPGPYLVETTVGDDGSTVVTSNINMGGSYFSTANTIVAAVDQGYFAPAVLPPQQSWQQIELESGLTGRQERVRKMAMVDDDVFGRTTGGADFDIWGDEG